MVLRKGKKNRKYLGSRSWGVGNIKNARGAGDRGGVGKGKRKHRFTYFTAKEPESIRKHGFHPFKRKKFKEVTLAELDRKLSLIEKEGKDASTIELLGYKVLSNGNLSRKVVIKASGFSKKAKEKIKNVGGEAIEFK